MEEKQLLTIMERFDASGITELELSEGNLHLLLRKSYSSPTGGGRVGVRDTDSTLPQPPPVGEEPGETITSPIVGVYYASPSPDSPAFVSGGSRVKKGDTLCILEAMKMMNRLEAEFDCEILAIHAKVGDLVEYGQALFRVKRL